MRALRNLRNYFCPQHPIIAFVHIFSNVKNGLGMFLNKNISYSLTLQNCVFSNLLQTRAMAEGYIKQLHENYSSSLYVLFFLKKKINYYYLYIFILYFNLISKRARIILRYRELQTNQAKSVLTLIKKNNDYPNYQKYLTYFAQYPF